MLRVDTHFHPNFSFWLPRSQQKRHARKIWETFAKRHLDVVFVSEHAFHQPIRAFETLRDARPGSAETFIVPAIEALSKEGIDMIVFSKDAYVYTQRDIITPYALTIEELVSKVRKDPHLFGVIPHPYAPSSSGILHHRSVRTALKEMNMLHCVEKFNASLEPLNRVIAGLHLTHVLKNLTGQLHRTIHLPANMTPDGITLLGGSDAHHLWDIGSCVMVKAPRPRTYGEAFAAVTDPSLHRSFHFEGHITPLLSVIVDGWTAFREHCMRKLRLYRVEKPLPMTQWPGRVTAS